MAKNANIGALHVKLGLDTAQFSNGLKTAQGKLSGFGKTAGFALAAAATAAAAAGVAIAAGVKSAIDAADELGKTAQKVGVGVEALSRLKYAGELADVSLDQLSGGLKKLSVNMAEVAAGGGDKAATAFRTLGVAVTDAAGNLRGSDAVFADVAEKFAGMRDGAQKTALAVALFGKSGSDLIPLLNAGRDGLAEMGAEADALGVTITANTAAAAEQFNDNLTRLKAAGTGVTTTLAAGLAPALASITDGLVHATKGAGIMDGVSKALGFTLKLLASVAVGVTSAIAWMANGLSAAGKIVMQVFRGDFAGAAKTYGEAFKKQFVTFGDAGAAIQKIWSNAGAQAKAVAPSVGRDLASPMDEAAKRTKAAGKSIKDEAEKATEALREFVAAEQNRLATQGLDSNQVKIRELQIKANEAVKLGLEAELVALLALIDAYRQMGIEAAEAVDAQVDLVSTPADIAQATEAMRASAIPTFEDIADAFYQISQAVDDVFYGFKSNDWVSAFSGLTRALKQVQAAFSATGTSADKFAAAAGIASGIGNAVGGTGGAALSGAASGALTGFTVAGPVGAVVGGILGGLGGLFGASKAKKRAKKEAAERARQEAERKAAELAAAKRELELRLLEQTGGALAAETERRKDLLAAMDPSLRALQEELWLRQDAAAAGEAAAAQVAERLALERQLLALTDAEGALAADRADALAALDPASRAVQEAIYRVIDAQAAQAEAQDAWAEREADAADAVAEARDSAAEAAENEADRLADVAARFGDLADGLAAVRDELKTDSLAGGDPLRRAGAARRDFDRLFAAAQTGDEQALGALPDAIRELVAAGGATATTARQLEALRAEGRRAATVAEAAARGRVTEAQQQLAALNAQVSATLGVQSEIKSLADRFAAFAGAVEAQQATMAAAAQAMAAATQVTMDAQSVRAALAPGGPVTALNDNSASIEAAVAAAMAPYLDRIAAASETTATLLDDVTQGGDYLRTAVVP